MEPEGGDEDKGKFEVIEKVFRVDPNDERPLSSKSTNFMLSEYPDGEQPPADFVPKKLPPKRFQKKDQTQPELAKKNTVDEPIATAEAVEVPTVVATSIEDRPIRKNNDFNDDRPLGSKKFDIPEFSEGGDDFKPATARPPKRFAKASTPSEETSSNDKAIVKAKPTAAAPASSDSKPWLKNKPVSQLPIDDIEEERQLQPSSSKINHDDIGSDDRPIGGGIQKVFQISEYPEGVDAADAYPNEDQSAAQPKDEGPLSKRIVSKIVRTRMQAFEELAAELASRSKDKALFDEYDSDWDKRLSEINPGVQEQMCIALKNWITYHPSGKALKMSDAVSVMKMLIEKCITGGKPQVLAASKDLVILIFERCYDASEFYEGLNACVRNKNAKVGVAGIQAITEMLINYGPKKLDFMKPFFGEIEKQSLSTNAVIRNECMTFFKEAMKWLGDTIVKNYTKNLKKLQLDELEKFYSEWDKQPMIPLRASEEEKRAAEKSAASGGGSGGAASGDIDLFEMADAVDIFGKYSEKWCDKVLGLAKWNEKKEMLDDLIAAASQPKVIGNGFMPVVGMIKRLLNDNHSGVQYCAVRLMGCLAKSMRKGFSSGVKQLYEQILFRFRDKKTQNADETKLAIDNFWFSISLEDVTEEIKEGLLDKAPPMKLQIMQVIERYFEARPTAVKAREAFKQACLPTIKKLFDDSSSEVREECLKLVGKLNKQKDWFKHDELEMLIAGLNEQKKQKIQQGRNEDNSTTASKLSSTLGNTAKPQQPPVTQKPGSTQNTMKPPAKSYGDDEEDLRSSRMPPSKKPTASSSTASTSSTQIESLGSEDVPQSSIPSNEDCMDRLRENGMEEEDFKRMIGTKNPDKVEIISRMPDFFATCLLEVLVYLDKVAFKSSILTVQKEIISLIEAAVAQEKFNKQCFHVISDFLIRNIGDAKFNGAVASIIERSCEKLLPKYVVSRLIRVIKQDEKKGMAPKSAQELCRQIAQLIDLAPIRLFNVQEMLAFAKETVQNTNVSIKSGGQDILKKLYEHMGEQLVGNFLKDIPANVLSTLQKEFGKLAVLTETEKQQRNTMRFYGEAAKEASKNQSSSQSGKESSNPLQSMIDALPRADISKDAERISKKLGDSQWKIRKEGFDELDAVIAKANNRIQIAGLFDLLALLKQSLSESNKGLQRQAFNFIGRFAEACGKDIKPHSKNLLCNIVSNLSNKESLMRKEVILALDRFEKAIGGETIINIMPSYLIDPSPDQRQGIIEWIIRHPDSYANADLNAFVIPILTCLDDKSKDIRVLAEQLLEKTIQITSAEPFKSAFKDMKPATVKVIKPIISKYTNLDDEQTIDPLSMSKIKLPNAPQKPGASKTPIAAKQQAASKDNPGTARTMTRNATTVNLKTDTGFSDSLTNGEKTPVKLQRSKLVHSQSSNKLPASKQDVPTLSHFHTPAESRANSRPASRAHSGSRERQNYDQRSGSNDKYELHISDLQSNQEPQRNAISSASSGRLISMVDASAKRPMMDDSVLFPLSSSISSLKTKRMACAMQQSFSISNPSNEQFEFITNELRFLLSPNVTPNMFSFNYKCLIKAAEEVKGACSDHMQMGSLKYLSDLLFQWCFMRMYGNFNVEVCLHLLDTMRTMLQALLRQQESLSDLEVGVINASIRECLMNLPETSSVFQQIYVIVNLQSKILGQSSEKVVFFWLNQLGMPLIQLHPQYFESESLSSSAMQADYLHKLCELFSKAFLKDINPATALQFFRQIQYTTQRTLTFLASLIERFGPDLLLQAGFSQQYIDTAEQIHLQSSHQQMVKSSSFVAPLAGVQMQGFVTKPQPSFPVTSAPINIQNILSDSSRNVNSEPSTRPHSTSITGIQSRLQEKLPYQNSQQQQPQSTISIQPSTSQLQQPSAWNQFEETFVSKVRGVRSEGFSEGKIEQLAYINGLLQESDKAENIKLIEKHAGLLLDMIISQLTFCFENRKNPQASQYLPFFLNVMYKCFIIKSFAKHCAIEPLKSFTEQILCRLLAEDESQTKEDAAGSSIVRLLNSTMLRILEHSRPEHIYKILMELLIKYREQFNYAKIIGLIIKCILKVTKTLAEFIHQMDLVELFLYIHVYVCKFLMPTPTLTDDIGIKTIKTIIKELCKIKGEAIWDVYRQAIANHPTKDHFISEWINVVIKPAPAQIITSNLSGIQTIATPRDLRMERMMSQGTIESPNAAVKRIIETIKKTDSPDQEIAQLYEVLTLNPSVSITQRLSDCAPKFAQFVMQSLEKHENALKNPQQTNNNNFNHFIPTQPQAGYDEGQYHTRNDDMSNQTTLPVKPMEYENLHNRINEFKQRIGRKETTQLSDLESLQQMNSQSAVINVGGTIEKTYPSKTTEELMQRVNDMKSKMQNVIKTNSGSFSQLPPNNNDDAMGNYKQF